MPKTPRSDRGISRVETSTTRGWFARVYHKGVTHSKLFSDRKIGGKAKAKAAAKKYRDELTEELVIIQSTAKRIILDSNDPSSPLLEIGILRTIKTSPTGKRIESFTVTWHPKPSQQKSISYSIHKHGEEKAYVMAVACLQRKIAASK